MLKMFFKMGEGLEKWGDAKSKQLKKAMSTALKREGYLLAKELKKEIRKGVSPELSTIARYGKGKVRLRKPFTRLRSTSKGGGGLIPIRYNPVMDGKKLQVEIGMVDTRQEKISKSWKYIFQRQQEGFSETITQRRRRYFAAIGGGIATKTKTGRNVSAKKLEERGHFFLRKSTKTFKTPGRPVIDPFWQKWERQSMQRLSNNFHKKMAGERI